MLGRELYGGLGDGSGAVRIHPCPLRRAACALAIAVGGRHVRADKLARLLMGRERLW